METNGAVIFWRNPLRNEPDYEEFDSMDEAMAELEVWKSDYPWNTYTVASVTHVHRATAKWPGDFQYTVTSGPGNTTCSYEPLAQGERTRTAAGKEEI